MLKRKGRFLVGAPRHVQSFQWQAPVNKLGVFTHSDWDGCRTTCRSIRGGVMMSGFHSAKTWSNTQARVALSSAEALTKNVSQAFGLMRLLDGLG